MKFYWVDLTIIGAIVLSVLTGLVRGFVKELFALIAWVLAIWLALNYSATLDPWLSNYLPVKTTRIVVEFIVILMAALIVGNIINLMVTVLLKSSGFSVVDRILGMIFGFVRGIFIITLIMLALKITVASNVEYLYQSQLFRQFNPLVNWMAKFVPTVIKKVNKEVKIHKKDK